jgi:hypothetical protein
MSSLKQISLNAFVYFFCQHKCFEKMSLKTEVATLVFSDQDRETFGQLKDKLAAVIQVCALKKQLYKGSAVAEELKSFSDALNEEERKFGFGPRAQSQQTQRRAFPKLQDSEFQNFDQVLRKLTKQLNTLESRANAISNLKEAETMISFMQDFG